MIYGSMNVISSKQNIYSLNHGWVLRNFACGSLNFPKICVCLSFFISIWNCRIIVKS